MKNILVLILAGLITWSLTGCVSSYTMTTKSGEIIKTQGQPDVDSEAGITKYADAYGYHRKILTSEIIKITEGDKVWMW